MKQGEVAARHGIDQGALSRVLSGKILVGNLSIDRATKISAILDWPLEQVLKSRPDALKLRFTKLYECNNAKTSKKLK